MLNITLTLTNDEINTLRRWDPEQAPKDELFVGTILAKKAKELLRPIQAGDLVRFTDRGSLVVWEVLAVDEDQAWLKAKREDGLLERTLVSTRVLARVAG